MQSSISWTPEQLVAFKQHARTHQLRTFFQANPLCMHNIDTLFPSAIPPVSGKMDFEAEDEVAIMPRPKRYINYYSPLSFYCLCSTSREMTEESRHIFYENVRYLVQHVHANVNFPLPFSNEHIVYPSMDYLTQALSPLFCLCLTRDILGVKFLVESFDANLTSKNVYELIYFGEQDGVMDVPELYEHALQLLRMRPELWTSPISDARPSWVEAIAFGLDISHCDLLLVPCLFEQRVPVNHRGRNRDTIFERFIEFTEMLYVSKRPNVRHTVLLYLFFICPQTDVQESHEMRLIDLFEHVGETAYSHAFPKIYHKPYSAKTMIEVWKHERAFLLAQDRPNQPLPIHTLPIFQTQEKVKAQTPHGISLVQMIILFSQLDHV